MIQVEHDGSIPVVSILGEVDLSNVEQLNRALSTFAGGQMLVVSLERTDFIDSTVLGTLIKHNRMRPGRMVLVLPQTSRIYRLFVVTDLVDHFAIAASRDEAFERAASLAARSASSASR